MRLIDTNVLIDYPSIVQQEDIAIAWEVLEELDRRERLNSPSC